MESPPPYYSPAPKKSNTGLIVGLVLGAIVLCCILPIGVIGGLGFWGFQKAKGLVQCSITIQNLQQSLQAYAAEHQDRLPSASTWEKDVKPYYAKRVKNDQLQKNPFASSSTDGSIGCTDGDNSFTGISFNKALSGKKLSEIKDPADTVLLFEVPTTGENLNADYTPQPFQSSPKILNAPRGWYVIHPTGSAGVINQKGEMTFDTGPGIQIQTTPTTGTDKN
jgi:hypothetical protein